MENINIAKLLKDCPKGMELDCTIWNNVTFEGVDDREEFSIIIRLSDGSRESCTDYGCYDGNKDAKCVIFPKGKTTWEGFVPPCQFKDGDIVINATIKDSNAFIYAGETNLYYKSYVGLMSGTCSSELAAHKSDVWCDKKHKLRLATEEEKQKLFDAIKVNGYKWNAETKTLEKHINRNKFVVGTTITNGKIIGKLVSKDVDSYKLEDGTYVFFNEVHNWELVPNKFDITTLVPFESKVLVRNADGDLWKPAIYGFSHSKGCYVVGGIYWGQYIPYKDNQKLLGTTNDCDEYYKTWK